jgi:preprotein translocase subunit SecE
MKTPTGSPESTSASPPKKRVGPFTFINQVRAEARKVTWTSFPELRAASIMVIIMVLVAAVFFYLTDTIVKILVAFVTGISSSGAPPIG